MANKNNTTIKELINKIREFRDQLEWKMYHKPKDLAISIAIETAELLELFQWLDDEDIEQLIKHETYKQKIAEELADITIYILSLTDVLGIDLAKAIQQKLNKNKQKYNTQQHKGQKFKQWLIKKHTQQEKLDVS